MASRDTGVKRNHVSLSVAQKLELIEQLEQGVSVARVCNIYGVKKQTVSNIRKSKLKLQQFSTKYSANSNECASPVGNRKRMKGAQDKDLEEAVYMWYVQQKAIGVNIRSLDLKSAYKTFGKNMGLNNKASDGWLWRFRKRHNIVLKGQKDGDLEWTSGDIESLISLVQINNVIYDQSDPDYNNREITDNIWKQISSKLNRSPESCSKKWHLLHSEYQEKKNFNSNQNIDYKSYFDKIGFLKEFPCDKSNNLTPDHENSPNDQSSETCTYNKNTNEDKFSISEENIDIKTEFEDDDNITELQNHSENEISNDAESCGRFNADYLDNVMDNDYGLNEMDSYDNVDFGNRLKPGVNRGGKNNSMELFLLSLVEDASCLSKPSQKEFKLKTLALLNSLE